MSCILSNQSQPSCKSQPTATVCAYSTAGQLPILVCGEAVSRVLYETLANGLGSTAPFFWTPCNTSFIHDLLESIALQLTFTKSMLYMPSNYNERCMYSFFGLCYALYADIATAVSPSMHGPQGHIDHTFVWIVFFKT
jgi:hypothetical protein